MSKDDEVDLDLDMAAKRLTGDLIVKKKSKSKAKAKKSKVDEEPKSSVKSNSNLPLSMQSATTEDKAQYELRFSAFKNNVSSAKEYKMTHRFKQGEVLNHKTFGIGFVVSEVGINKMEVLFAEGRKLLIMGQGMAPKGP